MATVKRYIVVWEREIPRANGDMQDFVSEHKSKEDAEFEAEQLNTSFHSGYPERSPYKVIEIES